jgi:hypothetical protein
MRNRSAADALVHEFPRPADVLARRFAQGTSCHSAIVNGRFGGFIWISRQCYEEDEVRCSYRLDDPQRCVWDFDVYVPPELRMGRTLARLWQHVDALLAAEGVAWSLSRISAFNRASQQSHARLGAVQVGWAVFLVLGPVQLALATRTPYLHLSLTRASRPTLTVRAPSATPPR